MSYDCEICSIKFTTKRRLNSHIESEKHKTVKRIHDNLNTKYQQDLNNLNNQLNVLKIELQSKNEIILNIINELNDKNKEIKHLQNKAEEYRKIVEKSATKTTVKNNNNYTHNNYLNYISQEPINFSNLKNELKNVVTTKSIMYDDEYFHDHIMDNILKDKNGKDKVLCTDINRKNFSYKDENTGQLISDPELDNLRTKLRNGVKLKQVRNELLERLKKEHEDNGNIGKDPYVKFYEMIQKLNFGVPFVEHVAKKTYVKSKNSDIKPNNKTHIDNNKNNTENQIENTVITEKIKDELCKSLITDKNGKEYVSIIHISDEKIREIFTEEEYLEYQELVKEFGKELICD